MNEATKTPVQGLHHITAMASDPQRNIDFFVRLLGQRLVKLTVNFDDPGTYHLYYGDEVGSPGTIMTYFPWPNAKRGERGNGEAVAFAYGIRANALGGWKARLSELNLDYAEVTRFGRSVLSFTDPDGLGVELIAEDGADEPRPWPRNPVPDALRLRGFHSVTLWVDDVRSTRELLVGHLGFAEVGSEPDPEGPRYRFKGDSDGVGLYVDAVERPGRPTASFGAGSIHHVALRTRDDAEQAVYLRDLRAARYNVTPVQDRQYFHSIYFRDASGVLFEIATDAPGFAYDEPVDELGSHLKLPDWFEGKRAAIEAHVPTITSPEYNLQIGAQGKASAAAPSASGERKATGPHADSPVYGAGRPLEQARLAVVLVHGRGGSARDILGLESEFGLSAYTYLAPEASGNTWYPLSFLAPIERNEPHLTSALSKLDDVFAHLREAGISAERVVLGGFSQGACLALEYAARNAKRYGAVFGYSGGLIGPDGTPRDYTGTFEGTPVFLGCSNVDPHIPVGRVKETASVLQQMGANVDARIYPGMAHTINAEEIQAVRALMHALASQLS
ncbi:VOC family protein [Deinococcus yavapaiensis]|uniref:Glyoxalase family protein n=1 Tax=Deinococcus yavapaiensis KR-236 TaxID=694435 RepID=A0A318SBU8_9DEIO|nr:VOC family protein [Deinococcus yavapaiensis]PYE54764.1 glyoxalase family protein [Deinococcus yavapaiensis KR-236]